MREKERAQIAVQRKPGVGCRALRHGQQVDKDKRCKHENNVRQESEKRNLKSTL